MNFLFLSLLFDRRLDVVVSVQNVDAVLGQMLHLQHLILAVVFRMVEYLAQLVFFHLQMNGFAIN